MNSILITIEDTLATIIFNRPEVYNSFNRDMAIAFLDALIKLDKDENVRCILLTGNGKAFSAGQDLQEVLDPQGPGLEIILLEHYNPIIRKLRSISKPVIAAVNGVAAGAGANIALACDIVLASESASFIQAFSKIGLIPDSGGTFFLPRLIGWQRASALMMTGDKVTATDAQQMGMVYKVFPVELFSEAVMKFAKQIGNMPTTALFNTRRLLNASLSNNLDQQLEHELELQILCGETYDYKEGVQAFIEKRNPEFKGR
ncbi:MAG: enoyl-CoA hydratase/isomerase family protein [Saprospiraceae bacterium]|nr:enoyl-CoA hydratase/isomerase family protein [Saprospiraceae bacterium]